MKFKKNIKRTIKYATDIPSYDNALIPAKTVIPDWYKKTPKHPEGYNPNRIPYPISSKACAPFLDSFNSGYVLTTPCSIGVDNLTDTDTVITWNKLVDYEPINLRDSKTVNEFLPIPGGCSSQHFVWSTKVCFEIPKGYSALITHPLNRHDLPFTTLSAVIDGRMLMHYGSIPVFFKKSFNGVIPKGTPFAQIILFKRENWESKEDAFLLKEQTYNTFASRSTTDNWYKKTHWRKKTYN